MNHNDALDRHSDFLTQVTTSNGLADSTDILNLGLQEFQLLDGTHPTFERRRCQRARRHDQRRAFVTGGRTENSVNKVDARTACEYAVNGWCVHGGKIGIRIGDGATACWACAVLLGGSSGC